MTDRPTPERRKSKCPCPVYCKYCGRRRSRDMVGHYCKTHNCQWEHGYSTCDPKWIKEQS